MKTRVLHVITSQDEEIRFVVRTYYRWDRETGASENIARRNAKHMECVIRRVLADPYGGGWGGLRYGSFPYLFNKYLDSRMKQQNIIVDYNYNN